MHLLYHHVSCVFNRFCTSDDLSIKQECCHLCLFLRSIGTRIGCLFRLLNKKVEVRLTSVLKNCMIQLFIGQFYEQKTSENLDSFRINQRLEVKSVIFLGVL